MWKEGLGGARARLPGKDGIERISANPDRPAWTSGTVDRSGFELDGKFSKGRARQAGCHSQRKSVYRHFAGTAIFVDRCTTFLRYRYLVSFDPYLDPAFFRHL